MHEARALSSTALMASGCVRSLTRLHRVQDDIDFNNLESLPALYSKVRRVQRFPALAEDAGAGLPATREVNLAGGNPLAFFRRRLASGYWLVVWCSKFLLNRDSAGGEENVSRNIRNVVSVRLAIVEAKSFDFDAGLLPAKSRDPI